MGGGAGRGTARGWGGVGLGGAVPAGSPRPGEGHRERVPRGRGAQDRDAGPLLPHDPPRGALPVPASLTGGALSQSQPSTLPLLPLTGQREAVGWVTGHGADL